MIDLEEVLRCLETLHLTDPALLPQRESEIETVKRFLIQLTDGGMYTRRPLMTSRAERERA